MLGKEAGLFLASGTQSNLVGLLTHCQRGDEYIAGSTAHTYKFEGGGAAALGGIQPQTLPFEADGTLDLEAVESLIKPENVHFANTRLLCLENTQDGKATGAAYFAQARALVDELGLGGVDLERDRVVDVGTCRNVGGGERQQPRAQRQHDHAGRRFDAERPAHPRCGHGRRDLATGRAAGGWSTCARRRRTRSTCTIAPNRSSSQP